jgi:hypothetical protein
LQPAFEKAIAGLANIRLRLNDPKDAAGKPFISRRMMSEL